MHKAIKDKIEMIEYFLKHKGRGNLIIIKHHNDETAEIKYNVKFFVFDFKHLESPLIYMTIAGFLKALNLDDIVKVIFYIPLHTEILKIDFDTRELQEVQNG